MKKLITVILIIASFGVKAQTWDKTVGAFQQKDTVGGKLVRFGFSNGQFVSFRTPANSFSKIESEARFVLLARTLINGYGINSIGDFSANRTVSVDTTTATGLVSKARLTNSLNLKVDKVTGKSLLADGEITKLAAIIGTNTGNETTSTIQSKRPLKTIEGQSLEGAGNIDLTKSDVGLPLVDNTSDVNKPVSTATQTALNLKVNIADSAIVYRTFLNSLSKAETQTKLNLKQDALGFTPTSITGFTGVQSTSVIKTGLALVKGDVGLGNVDNTTDLNKPISSATQTALNLKANSSLIGANSGIASLDGGGKVPLAQINDVLLGSVNYKGTYNASTNVPTLPAASNKGFYYIVSTGGTQQGINFTPGDWIISDGTNWGKVDNNNAVTSVNGQVGSVSLSTSNIAEGSNLYYTDTRVSNNSAVVANTAKITNTTHTGDATGATALTLATVNTNVGSFGTGLLVPVITVNAKGLTTAVSSTPIPTANTTIAGLITPIDWNTFNNKQTALGYTPTSITGFTGVQSTTAIKTGLALVKSDVGLGNVDNTTDANKPISTATQTSLNLKANLSGGNTLTGNQNVNGDISLNNSILRNITSLPDGTYQSSYGVSLLKGAFVRSTKIGADTVNARVLTLSADFDAPLFSINNNTTRNKIYHEGILTFGNGLTYSNPTLRVDTNSTGLRTNLNSYSKVESNSRFIKFLANSTLSGFGNGVLGVDNLGNVAVLPAADRTTSNTQTRTTTSAIVLSDFGANGYLFIRADATAGNITITLPTATVMSGLVINVKKVDATANTVTISASSIDGVTTRVLSSLNVASTISSNGTVFNIVGENIGQSPSFSGAITSTKTSDIILSSNVSGTSRKYIELVSTGSAGYFGVESSTGGSLFTGSLPYATLLGSTNSTAVHIGTNQIIGYTMDASRNNTWTGTGSFGGTVSAATPTASNHLTTKAYVDATSGSSGRYTPTISNTSNVASSSAQSCKYTRVGNIVTVYGTASVTPTSSGLISLNISLPVASNLASTIDLSGNMVVLTLPNTTYSQGYVSGHVANDTATISGGFPSATGSDISFSFSYQVL